MPKLRHATRIREKVTYTGVLIMVRGVVRPRGGWLRGYDDVP